MTILSNNDNSFQEAPEYQVHVYGIPNDFLFQPSASIRRSTVLVYGKSYLTFSNKPIVILRGDNVVAENTDDTRFFDEESFLMYESAKYIILSEVISNDNWLSETRRAIYDYIRLH